MKNGRVTVLILLPLLVGGCSTRPQEPASYADEIRSARTAKDRAFLEGAESPVPAARRPELLPLTYFPVDQTARAPAVLRPADEQIVIEMPTSTGTVRAMRRLGTLEFSLKGQPLKLTAFGDAGAATNRLFVPFTDLTTGGETYAAGRYLDLDPMPTGIYEIDFNRAYHPFCYFDARFDCPYPPAENRLKVPIRAGERLPAFAPSALRPMSKPGAGKTGGNGS